MTRVIGIVNWDADAVSPERKTSAPSALRRFQRNRPALAALAVLALLALLALFAGLLAPHHPNIQDCEAGAISGASLEHPLGTDSTCRDVLSRLIFGARVSLAVGLLAPFMALAIALPVGAVAALSSRLVDNVLMRLTDLAFAFPDLLLIILLRQALLDSSLPGGSIFAVTIAIALVGWTTMARLVRAQLLAIKSQDFILAAQALGATRTRLVLAHMLPNSAGPLLAALAFAVPQAIFAEAALSFLGLGVLPPQASWGNMIASGYGAIYARPLLVIYPALAIAVTMLAVTLIADGLRDALDPRQRTPRGAGTP